MSPAGICRESVGIRCCHGPGAPLAPCAGLGFNGTVAPFPQAPAPLQPMIAQKLLAWQGGQDFSGLSRTARARKHLASY
ncbi:hypothetical protein CBM2623_A120063 [Cupriavidus taiwanensis]|nr:hypothetical protein CBM2623_A120063 [Cupriavidus taiwanensis]SPA43992.1 hypothetical protein CBM2629_A100190 [Cupriavidus taiwanensis]